MKRGTLAIRLFLAAVFFYSGLVKASGSAQFAIALAPFAMVPDTWIHPLSVLLPFAEIAGAALILVPWTRANRRLPPPRIVPRLHHGLGLGIGKRNHRGLFVLRAGTAAVCRQNDPRAPARHLPRSARACCPGEGRFAGVSVGSLPRVNFPFLEFSPYSFDRRESLCDTSMSL